MSEIRKTHGFIPVWNVSQQKETKKVQKLSLLSKTGNGKYYRMYTSKQVSRNAMAYIQQRMEDYYEQRHEQMD